MIIDYRTRWVQAVRVIKDREAQIVTLETELREARADWEDLIAAAHEDGIEAAKTHLIKSQRASLQRLKSQLAMTERTV